MAELDTMNLTEVGRGTQPVSRNEELSAISTGLSVTGKIVDEVAKADLRGDLAQAQEDSVAAASIEPTFKEFENDTDSAAVVGFINQMRKHQATAAQSTSSNLRTRAVLAMQTELQNAKAKYPWMRAELDAEANRFMGNNPTLTQLGIVDAAIKAGTHPAEQSQDWIDGIKDTAYGTPGSGGLGIDERVEFGTLEFAREYDSKMVRQQKLVNLKQDEALFQAGDTQDARKAVEITTSELESSYGTLSLFYEDLNRQTREVVEVRKQVRLGNLKESVGHATELEFQQEILPQLQIRITQAKAEMIDTYNRIWSGSIADEPQAEAMRSRVDAHIADLEILEATLSAGSTDIMDMMKTLSLMRGQDRLEEAPVLQDFADMAGAIGADALKAWDSMDLTFSTAYDQHLLSKGMGEEIRGIMFPSMAAHWRDTDGAETPAERRRNRNAAQNRSSAPAGRVSTTDPKVAVADALGQIEANIASASNPALQDPQADVLALNSLNGTLQSMANQVDGLEDGVLPDAEKRALRSAVSDTSIVDRIDRVGRHSPDVAEWVDKIETDYLGKLDPPKELANGVFTLAGSSMNGMKTDNPISVSALSILDIDSSKLVETGQIVFTVNDAAIQAHNTLPAGTSTQKNLLGFGSNRQERVAARAAAWTREAQAIADRLTEETTNYIRIQAHLAYAKNQALSKPEYGTAFVQPAPGSPSLDSIFKVMDDFNAGL